MVDVDLRILAIFYTFISINQQEYELFLQKLIEEMNHSYSDKLQIHDMYIVSVTPSLIQGNCKDA